MADDYALIGGAPGEPGSIPVQDNGHMHEGTAVKSLGDTTRYPDTEDGLKQVMRSEMDDIMGSAQFSFFDIIKSLFRQAGEVISSGVSGVVNLVVGAVSAVVGFLVDGLKAFASLFGARSKGEKEIPPGLDVEFVSPLVGDIDAALQPILDTGAQALDDAREAIDQASLVGANLTSYFNPDDPSYKLAALQEQVNTAYAQALSAHTIAIEANQAAIKKLAEHVTRVGFVPASGIPVMDHWTVTRGGTTSNPTVTLTAKEGWAGSLIATYPRKVSTSTSDSHDHDVTVLSQAYMPVPDATRGRSITLSTQGPITLTYTVNPGSPREESYGPGTANRPLSDGVWTVLQSWVAPSDTTMTARGDLVWSNKTFMGDYYTKITLTQDGVERDITVSSSSAGAPLFGHGSRAAMSIINQQVVKEGSVLKFWAKANHGNSLNRQVRDDYLMVTWVEPPTEGGE